MRWLTNSRTFQIAALFLLLVALLVLYPVIIAV